ncbi:uncharacterized protein LOC126443336 [Schistocerca serialis cubense]|uniref:uncharacterized protein LOC126443336 n=1 Tax=Schistocerca serialis cubense TaxID=2023355 RepID=UPI00214E2C92|nr:uncharacterized protein LOC126443336 [Schistocerca serialis cubense]
MQARKRKKVQPLLESLIALLTRAGLPGRLARCRRRGGYLGMLTAAGHTLWRATPLAALTSCGASTAVEAVAGWLAGCQPVATWGPRRQLATALPGRHVRRCPVSRTLLQTPDCFLGLVEFPDFRGSRLRLECVPTAGERERPAARVAQCGGGGRAPLRGRPACLQPDTQVGEYVEEARQSAVNTLNGNREVCSTPHAVSIIVGCSSLSVSLSVAAGTDEHMSSPWKLVSQSADLEVTEERFAVWVPRYTRCGSWEQPPPAWSAAQRLAARLWVSELPPPPAAGAAVGGGCAGALAQLRRLTWRQSLQLVQELECQIADDCIDSRCVPGSRFNLIQTAQERHGSVLKTWYYSGSAARDYGAKEQTFQKVNATCIHFVGAESESCASYRSLIHWLVVLSCAELQVQAAVFRERLSSYWRDLAQLLSLGATHAPQLLVPLAFELMGNHASDQQLHGWIKDMKRVKDMLHTKLTGWVQDLQLASKQAEHYEVEEDKDEPGDLIIRRPLLSERLLRYQPWNLSFHDDFSALCKERQPEASQMFSLADELYAFHRVYWSTAAEYIDSSHKDHFKIVDEEWQLEDRSHATLSVDTDCVQLLVNALDHPTCPLEDLPLEAVKQRLQCREQLWDDVVQRSPHIPVTSYLAYTQRINVNLCLLAWMAVNSYGICQDVPFSMIQSVHDARCYSDSPDDQSCLQSNATDAICSVSRAILLLKCRDFSSIKTSLNCTFTKFRSLWVYSRSSILDQKLTEETLNYKNGLNDATLKYKDFKIDSLKPLEISFILINIIFRLSTAGVYMYLPQLRNLPGKILLSFQMTCIVQILCSEVVYRMAGVPDLPTAVLIDSALTLLSCFWLNSFCYHMYACVRHLRLPNQLLPAEVSQLFCREMLCVFIPWSIVCVAAVALEKTSKYYLIHSRIVVLAGISVSVAFNLVCLGLLGYMYLRNRCSMRRLEIVDNKKFASKKECLFMSVKAIILSGTGIIIRIGFHQAQGIAQVVYYMHLVTMVQGPVLFVCFVCNGTTLPLLKNRILLWWNPTNIPAGLELCSAAERNLARRNNEQSPFSESSL